MGTTLTRSTAEEWTLGPTVTYTVETVDDDTDAARRVEYTRNVEGWFRTVDVVPAGDVIWQCKIMNAQSHVGAVLAAVAAVIA